MSRQLFHDAAPLRETLSLTHHPGCTRRERIPPVPVDKIDNSSAVAILPPRGCVHHVLGHRFLLAERLSPNPVKRFDYPGETIGEFFRKRVSASVAVDTRVHLSTAPRSVHRPLPVVFDNRSQTPMLFSFFPFFRPFPTFDSSFEISAPLNPVETYLAESVCAPFETCPNVSALLRNTMFDIAFFRSFSSEKVTNRRMIGVQFSRNFEKQMSLTFCTVYMYRNLEYNEQTIIHSIV